MKRLLAFTLVGLLFMGGALFWPPIAGFAQEPLATLMDVRVGHDAGRTRLVLDFDKPMTQRWFTLTSPARVVLDFPPINIKPDLNTVSLPPQSWFKALRAGTFRPGTTRMVLDLTKPARLSIFTIPGTPERGPRLVIDALPPTAKQPATNVPPPPDVVTTTPFAPGKTTPKPAEPLPNTPQQPAAPVVPPQVVTTPQGPVVVALDAGHGGVDPGACGKRLKLCEKGLTLEITKMVAEHLNQRKGLKVVLTRDHDTYVGLAERVKIAQRAGSSLFVSLHADSHPNPSVRGATVYMVSEKASDREAQRLAASENDGDILAGVDISRESPDVQNILVSLAQRYTLNHSTYLAQNMITAMDKVLTLRKTAPLYAGFKVLKAPDIPSILVEMGYLSNPLEEKRLADKRHRKELSKAIADGIAAYIEEHVR